MTMIAGNSLNKTLGLILLIVCLPIFAGLGMLSADYLRTTVMGITASAGIVSMGDMIIQFMPIFGIGIVFSLLAGFGLTRRGD